MKLYISSDFHCRVNGVVNGKKLSNEVVFETHEEIDKFVHGVSSIMGGSNFQQKQPAEFYLLKCFDRVCWTQLLFSQIADFQEEANQKNTSAKQLCEAYRMKIKPKGFHLTSETMDLSSDFTHFCLHDTSTRIYDHDCPFGDPRTMTLR